MGFTVKDGKESYENSFTIIDYAQRASFLIDNIFFSDHK
jgi:hypothetical protein